MGMSSGIEAFIPDTDPEYQRHKKILLACEEGGVSLPPETAKYFGDSCAEQSLLEEKLSVSLKEGVHFSKYETESCEGFEIDLASLPAGVTKIRFSNCW